MLFPSVLGAYQDHILLLFCYFDDNVRTTISLSIKTSWRKKSCIQLTHLCTSFKHQAIPTVLSILPLMSPHHNLIQQNATGAFGNPAIAATMKQTLLYTSVLKTRAECRYQDAPDILNSLESIHQTYLSYQPATVCLVQIAGAHRCCNLASSYFQEVNLLHTWYDMIYL
jgi:hypothetical protein